MTRKDYKAIAIAISLAIQDNPRDVNEAWGFLMNRIMRALSMDNPRFDYQKFEDAVYRRKGI